MPAKKAQTRASSSPKKRKAAAAATVASPKKRTRSTVEQEELAEQMQEAKEAQEAKERAIREKELDKDIPEKYRKYRPRGYPLYLPKDPESEHFRIYCDGIYDLFHLGHMNQLKQCKEMFPNVTLVVGVPSDKVTWKHKGLTVLTDEQRCETLLHCKWVDEVVSDAPWSVTLDFLKKHKIDYVAHDDIPYVSAGSDDVYKAVKQMGKFLVTQRTEGISTSDIITKIIRDYDKYLMRNFARGASRKELNVSWFKKNELELKKHIGEFRSYWKKTNKNFNNASKDLYYEVREYLRNGGNALRKINSSPNLALELESSRSPSPLSPAAEFASRFSGNGNRSGSLIRNIKKWVFKDPLNDYDLSDSDYDKESEKDSEKDSEPEPEPEQPKKKQKRA